MQDLLAVHYFDGTENATIDRSVTAGRKVGWLS